MWIFDLQTVFTTVVKCEKIKMPQFYQFSHMSDK